MRRARLAAARSLCLAALLGSLPHAAADDGARELLGPGDVQGVLREDVDGDGVRDLLLAEGRTLWLWRGRRDGLPSGPGRAVELPPDVSAVDALGKDRLLLLGAAGVREWPVSGERETAAPGDGLGWSDAARVTFVDLVRDARRLLPTADGWSLDGVPFPVERSRAVLAPGAFVEDAGKVTDAWPEVFLGPPAAPSAGPTLWALSGDRLVAQSTIGRTEYDVSFLPTTGERRLADLDGDGTPDLVHGEGTNQEIRCAFLRTPPPTVGPDGRLVPSGADPRPALASLHLVGYPLDPRTVDLDGDGRLDFVLTSIEIDPRNVVRALVSGQVTARTLAFLNRRTATEPRLFGERPDASVTSDVGLRIRFSYAGNFQVDRSVTIVVDGDYDGDGLCDLAIRTGPEEMTVRAGARETVWRAEGRTVRIPPVGDHPNVEAWAVDLSGDGRDELLLVYRRVPGGRDRIFVLAP